MSQRRLFATEALFGLLQTGNSAFAVFTALHLSYLYAEVLKTPAVAVMGAVGFATVVQLWMAARMGGRVDKVKSGRGGRTLLIVRGAVPFALGFIMLCNPPKTLSPVWLSVWLVVSLTVANAARSLFEVPYNATFADLTKSAIPRNVLATFRQVFHSLGEALASLGPAWALSTGAVSAGFGIFGLGIGLTMVAASCIFVLLVRRLGLLSGELAIEQNSTASLWHIVKRPNTLLFIVSYSCAIIALRIVMGLFPVVIGFFAGGQGKAFQFSAISFVGSTIGIPVWSLMARKIGRMAAYRLSLFSSALLALAVLWVPPGQEALFMLLFFCKGLASVAITMLGVALQADLVDAHESAIGVRQSGAVSSVFIFTSRASHGFGVLMVSVILVLAQCNGCASVYDNAKLLFDYAVITCVTLLFSALCFSPRLIKARRVGNVHVF